MTSSHYDPASSDLYELEKRLREEGFMRIMGLDEAGRGCLAGPVVAAGVILDPDCIIPGITDSKKLKAAKRQALAEQIRQYALVWTIAWCDIVEIDTLNILKASLKAMIRCVEKASPQPDFVLLDGNRGIDSLMIPSQTVIRGDGRSASIGAASILAKVYRDQRMAELHQQFPEFGWDKNAGYPTTYHYNALELHGFTPYHRTSFNLRTDRPYIGAAIKRNQE